MKHTTSSPYDQTANVSNYRELAPLKVPGLFDLHRMAMLLLAERAPAAASVLVVGAGGGLETLSLAQAQPKWKFTGVDPSTAMLDLARDTLRHVEDRVTLLEGTVDRAPPGPFDGATSILTLHHVSPAERLHTLRSIHQRLKSGARLVVAGHSAAEESPEQWMTRSVAFGDRGALDWNKSMGTARQMVERLHLLTSSEEVEMLQEAGFSEVQLFFAAFSFRGFVATS